MRYVDDVRNECVGLNKTKYCKWKWINVYCIGAF